MGRLVDVIDCQESKMNEDGRVLKKKDYELFGEVDELFIEFPITLGFISENIRYKPIENTTMFFLSDNLDRAAGMDGFLFKNPLSGYLGMSARPQGKCQSLWYLGSLVGD